MCHALGLAYEWLDAGDVSAAIAFGGNPLMTVPVLVDGDRTIWGSHNACRYLVERVGADPLGVEALDWEARNRLAVIHGVMDADVRLVLGKRTGLDLDAAVFTKAREVVRAGLAWLEPRIDPEAPLGYLTLCATAMWDHLRFYDLVPADAAPRIARLAERLDALADVGATRPVGAPPPSR
jgi:glutathione S-transferase